MATRPGVRGEDSQAQEEVASHQWANSPPQNNDKAKNPSLHYPPAIHHQQRQDAQLQTALSYGSTLGEFNNQGRDVNTSIERSRANLASTKSNNTSEQFGESTLRQLPPGQQTNIRHPQTITASLHQNHHMFSQVGARPNQDLTQHSWQRSEGQHNTYGQFSNNGRYIQPTRLVHSNGTRLQNQHEIMHREQELLQQQHLHGTGLQQHEDPSYPSQLQGEKLYQTQSDPNNFLGSIYSNQEEPAESTIPQEGNQSALNGYQGMMAAKYLSMPPGRSLVRPDPRSEMNIKQIYPPGAHQNPQQENQGQSYYQKAEYERNQYLPERQTHLRHAKGLQLRRPPLTYQQSENPQERRPYQSKLHQDYHQHQLGQRTNQRQTSWNHSEPRSNQQRQQNHHERANSIKSSNHNESLQNNSYELQEHRRSDFPAQDNDNGSYIYSLNKPYSPSLKNSRELHQPQEHNPESEESLKTKLYAQPMEAQNQSSSPTFSNDNNDFQSQKDIVPQPSSKLENTVQNCDPVNAPQTKEPKKIKTKPRSKQASQVKDLSARQSASRQVTSSGSAAQLQSQSSTQSRTPLSPSEMLASQKSPKQLEEAQGQPHHPPAVQQEPQQQQTPSQIDSCQSYSGGMTFSGSKFAQVPEGQERYKRILASIRPKTQEPHDSSDPGYQRALHADIQDFTLTKLSDKFGKHFSQEHLKNNPYLPDFSELGLFPPSFPMSQKATTDSQISSSYVESSNLANTHTKSPHTFIQNVVNDCSSNKPRGLPPEIRNGSLSSTTIPQRNTKDRKEKQLKPRKRLKKLSSAGSSSTNDKVKLTDQNIGKPFSVTTDNMQLESLDKESKRPVGVSIGGKIEKKPAPRRARYEIREEDFEDDNMFSGSDASDDEEFLPELLPEGSHGFDAKLFTSLKATRPSQRVVKDSQKDSKKQPSLLSASQSKKIPPRKYSDLINNLSLIDKFDWLDESTHNLKVLPSKFPSCYMFIT